MLENAEQLRNETVMTLTTRQTKQIKTDTKTKKPKSSLNVVSKPPKKEQATIVSIFLKTNCHKKTGPFSI